VLAAAFPKAVFYEFICFVTPEYKYLLKSLTRLSLQFTGVRIVKTDSDSHFARFVLGTAYGRGHIIVDAQHLVYEIDHLKNHIKNCQFVKFARPLNCEEAFTIPVAATKVAMMRILKGLHLLNFGAFFELNLLCFLDKVEILTEERRFGPEEYSLLQLYCHLIMKFFMTKMYLMGLWTPALD
jgi:hypothetical protein